MHNGMNNKSIIQLYRELSHKRKIGVVAEKVGMHRNTVRNQLKGASPLDPKMLEVATEVFADMQEEEREAQLEIEGILEQNAALMAGLD